MDVTETDLPGVGKRFEVDLRSGGDAVVVIHNTGRRELFYRQQPDADSELLLDLTDRESRLVGTILEGAYFQPVSDKVPETVIGDDVVIEWYSLNGDSPIVGESLGETNLRREFGITVLAIERGNEVTSNPEPEFVFEAEDTVIAIGSREQQRAFEGYLFE